MEVYSGMAQRTKDTSMTSPHSGDGPQRRGQPSGQLEPSDAQPRQGEEAIPWRRMWLVVALGFVLLCVPVSLDGAV